MMIIGVVVAIGLIWVGWHAVDEFMRESYTRGGDQDETGLK